MKTCGRSSTKPSAALQTTCATSPRRRSARVDRIQSFVPAARSGPALQDDSMFYVLIGEDAPDSLSARMAARPDHLARLEALRDEGRLLVAGPMPAIDSPDPGPAGFSGSLVIAEFGSLAEAEAWLAQDPYVLQGVFARTSVRPYKKVLP